MSGTVERVETVERFRLLEPEWRALEERTPPHLPFQYYDWAAAWWTHFHESRGIIRDLLDIRVLRSRSGQLVGIAPMMRTLRPGYGPMTSRQLHYFGADANITEVRGLVAAGADPAAAYGVLLEHLIESASTWDWVLLNGTPSDCAIVAAMKGHFAHVENTRILPNYVLTLAPTWDAFRAKLGRNIKESLRRCYNAPKRNGVALEFDVVSNRRAVAGALGDFFRLHTMRAESAALVPHRDLFDSAATRRFLVDVCERFSDRNAFRLFRIRIAGEVVAVRIGFVVGDSLYLYYSGFDPRYASYSIMTTVVAEAIKYAIAEGLRTANLSTGNDVSKTRWDPDETTYCDWLIVSPRLRGRLVYEATRRARVWLAKNTDGRMASLSSKVARVHGGGIERAR